MLVKIRLGAVVLLIVGLAGCVAAAAPPLRARTAGDCENAKTCAASGLLEMSNDGHAYIGILHLNDGSCINVSLPNVRSEILAQQAPKAADLIGNVVFFPYAEGVLTFAVNGRKVGYGTCAPYFLFVPDSAGSIK